jgi:ribosome maturation factor RimP
MSVTEVGLPPLLLFCEEVWMAPSLVLELIALLEPLAAGHGLELVNVEVAGGGSHRVVRVYLDRESGIDIDAIAAANAWISDALDPLPRLAGPYTLEVSSPGIERALRTRNDFVRFAGSRAVVKTTPPHEGRGTFTGTLAGMEGDDVVIDVDGTEHRLPFDGIERARLKMDITPDGRGSGRDS